MVTGAIEVRREHGQKWRCVYRAGQAIVVGAGQAQTDTNRTALDISLFILSASPLFSSVPWGISSAFLTREKKTRRDGRGGKARPACFKE